MAENVISLGADIADILDVIAARSFALVIIEATHLNGFDGKYHFTFVGVPTSVQVRAYIDIGYSYNKRLADGSSVLVSAADQARQLADALDTHYKMIYDRPLLRVYALDPA